MEIVSIGTVLILLIGWVFSKVSFLCAINRLFRAPEHDESSSME